MSDVEYLDNERLKIWERIEKFEARLPELEKQIREKSADSEVEAKEHASNALAQLESIKQSIDEIKKYNEQSVELQKKSGQHAAEIEQKFESACSASVKISDLEKNASETGNTIAQLLSNAQSNSDKIEEFSAKVAAMEPSLKEFESRCATGEQLHSKIDSLHKNIVSKNNEIKKLHDEIFGYTVEDENGKAAVVKGRKDELETAYKKLQAEISEHYDKAMNNYQTMAQKMAEFESSKKSEFENMVQTWQSDFEKEKEKIQSLLPGALTTGLSHAYAKKTESELKERSRHELTFKISIIIMILISLIPISISTYYLWHEQPISLQRSLIVLPLYLPLLWLAYSSSKKANLSKRLIEEYAHKEALSKTYEGLAKQIEGLGNNSMSEDLRLKLLYNVLEVSSENPGKLISDYNTSDHPVMEALDKSVKLANSIEKLANIPGFGKIVDMLGKKVSENSQ